MGAELFFGSDLFVVLVYKHNTLGVSGLGGHANSRRMRTQRAYERAVALRKYCPVQVRPDSLRMMLYCPNRVDTHP